MRVVAATSQFQPGDLLDLPITLTQDLANATSVLQWRGMHYAVGTRRSSGYREYEGIALYAVILIPLGKVLERTAPICRAEPQIEQRGAASEATIDIATFYCGEQRLGLPRTDIVEALDRTHIRTIPNSPPWHAGLLMYAEQPLPVVDLAQVLGACNVDGGARNIIVVRNPQDGKMFGILVHELADIPEIASSRVLPVDDLVRCRGPQVLDRAVRPERPEDPVLMIVNLERLLLCTRAAGIKSASTPPRKLQAVT
jgi:chemotaxis signal transduction protein